MPRSIFRNSALIGLLWLALLAVIGVGWVQLLPPGFERLDRAFYEYFPLVPLPSLFWVVLTAYVVLKRRWRRLWDEAFEGLDLLPVQFPGDGRRYSGRVAGARVEAWLYRDRPGRLQIEVQRASPTPRHARFLPPVAPFGIFGVAGVVHLAQARGPAGEPVPIVVDGDPVAHELIAEPAFRAAVGGLLERHPGGGAAVRTTPDGWLFAWSGLPMRARHEPEITLENVRAWVDGLAAVAAASAHRNV